MKATWKERRAHISMRMSLNVAARGIKGRQS